MTSTGNLTISLGADHRGYALKQALQETHPNITWLDRGTDSTQRADYPRFAHLVSKDIKEGTACIGILLCGSGVGIGIAANRHPGIYAALCWRPEVATSAREDDGANVLVLPADYLTLHEATAILQAFLAAQFKGGIYAKRLAMIDEQ